jgi:hypothetical protein
VLRRGARNGQGVGVAHGLGRDDLLRWLAGWIRPDTATLLVIGDTDLAELTPKLEKAFAGWKAPGTPPPQITLPAAKLGTKPRVLLVDQPGALQANLVVAQLVPPSTDPGVGAFTLIRFAPQASSDDITKFLEANKLSIAAGPMAGGLYKVRVAVTGIPKGELANIVKKLQQDKVVGFIATTE